MFFLGLFLGASLGVVIASFLAAAAHADDAESDAYLRRLQHTCGDRCAPVVNVHYDERGRRLA